jgi:hypothetical protein
MTQSVDVLNADQPVGPRSTADSGELMWVVVIATSNQVELGTVVELRVRRA